MSKYFVIFDNGCKHKNSAELAADGYARTLDGILLPSNDAKDNFVREVKNFIDKINLTHRRCRDVRVSTWNGEGFNVGIGEGLCYLRIYKVKKEL